MVTYDYLEKQLENILSDLRSDKVFDDYFRSYLSYYQFYIVAETGNRDILGADVVLNDSILSKHIEKLTSYISDFDTYIKEENLCDAYNVKNDKASFSNRPSVLQKYDFSKDLLKKLEIIKNRISITSDSDDKLRVVIDFYFEDNLASPVKSYNYGLIFNRFHSTKDIRTNIEEVLLNYASRRIDLDKEDAVFLFSYLPYGSFNTFEYDKDGYKKLHKLLKRCDKLLKPSR